MKEIRIILTVFVLLIIASCSSIESYNGFVRRGDKLAERQKYEKAFVSYTYAWQMVEREGADKPISYKNSKLYVLEKRVDMREKLGDDKGVEDDRKLATYIRTKNYHYEKEFNRLIEKLKSQGLKSCGPYPLEECVNNLILHGPQTIELPDDFLFIDTEGNAVWD